jgi:hypothetical protein
MRVKAKKIPALQRHHLWFVDDEREGCNFSAALSRAKFETFT